jgi:peptidoglycan/xylan/chitin deacetylase (PgdA/CDA1 family)
LGAAFGGLSPREVRAELRTLPHDDAEKLVDVLCREAGVDPVVQHGAPALLDWDELRGLARQGVTFGAHTRSHAALSHLDEQRARAEIRGSLADLRRELGESVCAIAYPYGIHDGTVARIAGEEGCALGLTCQNGMNHPDRTDPLRLCRTNITPRTSPTVFAVRMLPWFVEVDRWRQRHKQIPATA